MRKVAIVLRMVMDAAVRDGMIRTNPVTGIRQPRIERTEAPYFAPAVVDSIADTMPSPEYRTLVRVFGLGGLRFGEAAALTRDRIDVLRRRVMVSETLTEVGGRLHRTATKTYQAWAVPLAPTLAAELAAHLAADVGPAPDAPIFRAPGGREPALRGLLPSPLAPGAGRPQPPGGGPARPAPLGGGPHDPGRRLAESGPVDPRAPLGCLLPVRVRPPVRRGP